LSAAGRAASDATTTREFLTQLNALRDSLGLSYTQIAAKAGKGMSRSTAQAMLTRDVLPSRRRLHQFLRACKVSQDELTLWTRTWEQLSTPNDPAPNPAPTIISPTTPHDTRPLAAQSKPSADAPAAPTNSPQQVWPLRPSRRANGHMLAGITTLITVISGSAIAMWMTHVPTEVMFAVYGLVIISISSWTAIVRAAIYEPRTIGRGRAGAPPPNDDQNEDRDIYHQSAIRTKPHTN
jgi:transcriptional regulator with XRE-family HTH domain